MQNRAIVAIKKATFSLLLFTAIFHLSACVSHYGAAEIVSTPPGAQVINSDGNVIGNTPVTMRWKNTNGHRETIIVKLKKPGYYEKTSSFWLDMRARNAKAASADPQLVEIEMQKVGEQ